MEALADVSQVFGILPGLSPDGQRLVLDVIGPNDHVWVYDLSRRTFSRLTTGWNNQSPRWTPDGTRIVFTSDRSGVYNLYWQPADGSVPAERLTESPHEQFAGSWSPDGEVFTFIETGPTNGAEIWLLTVERRVRSLIRTRFNNTAPRISPDGHWLAYVSDETGRKEVYIRRFPELGAKWQISSDGGMAPMWEPQQGRELYYRNGRKMMVVAIGTHPTFVAAAPRVLFEGSFVERSGYDVAPDGRFIMVEADPSDAAPPQITLIQNWFEELRRRVPAK